MKKIKGGISAPKGFMAAGISCGLKKSAKPDLALIYSEIPATAAGVFTTNQVKGNPVIVSQAHLKNGIAQAIISNSGNANTWTGKKGLGHALEMAKLAAESLGVSQNNVLVTSTGVIAKPLPMPKIRTGIKKLAKKLSKGGGKAAAKAILTTDTRAKEIAVKLGKITIAGIAKGAGMIEPNMCTMHAFITTDAKIDKKLLQRILKNAVDKSLNLVSVDGCMSTSDCVLVLANGLSKSKVQSPKSEFARAFEYVCEYLATAYVRGARNERDAKEVAKALINSPLLKAAVHGRDKNVGRILQAVGGTSAKVNWKKFKFDWKMGGKEDVISVNLASGKTHAAGWGCDLTEAYVKINSRYTT
jgi:glutamate N-acetyltransferase/amino-acid N-acetyltransferase